MMHNHCFGAVQTQYVSDQADLVRNIAFVSREYLSGVTIQPGSLKKFVTRYISLSAIQYT
jgi:hypothetical protein